MEKSRRDLRNEGILQTSEVSLPAEVGEAMSTDSRRGKEKMSLVPGDRGPVCIKQARLGFNETMKDTKDSKSGGGRLWIRDLIS